MPQRSPRYAEHAAAVRGPVPGPEAQPLGRHVIVRVAVLQSFTGIIVPRCFRWLFLGSVCGSCSRPLSLVVFVFLALLLPARSRGVRISTWYEHESTQEAFSFLRFVFAQNRELIMLPSLDEEYDLGKRPIKPIRYQPPHNTRVANRTRACVRVLSCPLGWSCVRRQCRKKRAYLRILYPGTWRESQSCAVGSTRCWSAACVTRCIFSNSHIKPATSQFV